MQFVHSFFGAALLLFIFKSNAQTKQLKRPKSKVGISGDLLQTEGKEESMPVADNNTPNGKAKNRRIEFIKI